MNTKPTPKPPFPVGPTRFVSERGEPLSGPAKMMLAFGAVILAVIVIAVLASCAQFKVGPFLPPHPVACSSDATCPEHMHCGFPAVDTRSICMDGDSDIDAPPEMGTRRKSLNCIVEDDAGELRYSHCADAGTTNGDHDQ